MIKIFLICASFFALTGNVYSDLPFNREIFENLLSGDNFRSLADYILESNHPCDIQFYRGTLVPEKVQTGDIVFVENSGLGVFFSEYYPNIQNPFILISHNHDTSAPREYSHYLEDEKIIMWFGFNPTIDHPKFVGIPLGLSNRDWRHSAQNENIINQVLAERALNNRKDEKPIFIYANFATNTAPKIRQPVFDYFQSLKGTPLGDKIVWASEIPFKNFAEDLANSEFVISPPGSGMDCHRVWESIYLGSIPIVIDSSLTTMYSDFPIIIIQKWEDLSIDFLLKKKEELKSKKLQNEKLYFNYWKNRILNLKKSIQQHQN